MCDLVPWPGIEPRLLHWQCRVLATEPPGKSFESLFMQDNGTVAYVAVSFSNQHIRVRITQCLCWCEECLPKVCVYLRPHIHKTQRCVHAQSRLILCDPMDCSSPGSSVHGILQARIFKEWVAVSLSRGSSPLRDWTHISCISCTAGRFFTAEPPGKPTRDLRMWLYLGIESLQM